MQTLGKALGTVALWGGASGLSYILNQGGLLDSAGAVWIVALTFISTWVIWNA
jgi:hypothetical protein